MTKKEDSLDNNDVENTTIIEDATIIEDEKMTNSEGIVKERIVKEGMANSSSKKISGQPKAKNGALAGVAFIIALLAAVTVAYIGWLSFQQAEQLELIAADSQRYHQQTKNLKQSLQAARTESVAAYTQRDQQSEQLSSALQDANLIIAAHGRRLRSLTSTTTDDWRLAEVEYLLRLANQRILISQDSATALSLLTTADEILLTLADPRFFDIRKSIAEDRAALVLVGQQDLDGVFLRLSALTQQLEKLPLIIIPSFEADNDRVNTQSNESTVSSWREKLNAIGESTWQELKSLVVVNKRSSDIKPLLPPEQQYYLRGNLQLMINQSQLALLDGRQAVYSDSLSRAERWLQDYFPSDEHAIQSVITEIQMLQQVKVGIELPDVTKSLLSVTQFLAQQHQVDISADVEAPVAPREASSVNAAENIEVAVEASL